VARITALAARTEHRPRRRPTAEAKLDLLEFLMSCEDGESAAGRALQWLAEHTPITRALCVGLNEDLTRLVGLAGHGVPASAVRRFSVSLEARDHPLVAALDDDPRVLGANGAEARRPAFTPLGSGPILVVPMSGRVGRRQVPAGLLLAAPAAAGASREMQWLGEVLGHRLARPQSYGRLTRERNLRTNLLDAVPDAVLLTDTEGRMLIANTRAEALFASREGESEGRRRAVALNNMLFSAALGQSVLREADRRELVLVDPAEGADLLFELLSTVVEDRREGTAIVSILRNVTDLRRATEEIEENYHRLRAAEAEVRSERDRLDLIIDSVADPIVVNDPGGNIVLMNAPAERLFSIPADAMPEEAQRLRANDVNFTSFVSNLFLGVADLRYRGGIGLVDPKTGAAVPVEAVSGKMLSDRGEVTAIVTILHDRTEAIEREHLFEQLQEASGQLEAKVQEATAELVRQNELLRRQALELEQASAAKSQFLANMSHEFRTPLNAILGYTSILLKGISGELAPQQRENLSRVDSNARHLLAIINDILDISRIEAGRMPLHVSEFHVRDLVTEVMTELEPIIVRSRLEVASEVSADLPTVRTDRAKLKQIVLNLLTNALKFTAEGSVRVVATPARETRQVAISVTDTGIGIAEPDQGQIFDDFQQADTSSTRAYGGAGLGLAICRRLVGMLDGQITVQSKLGQGSTFTVLVPLRLRRR
jgi:signal transduction histidine kinase